MAGTTLDQVPIALSLNGSELFWIYQPGPPATPWIGLSCTTVQIANFVRGVPGNAGRINATIRNVNLNVTGDTTVQVGLPSGVVNYRIASVTVANSVGALPTTATVGVYTAAAAGGTAIVTTAGISSLTSQSNATSGNMLQLTVINATTTAYNNTTLFVNVGTPQGSASTADIVIMVDLL